MLLSFDTVFSIHQKGAAKNCGKVKNSGNKESLDSTCECFFYAMSSTCHSHPCSRSSAHRILGDLLIV